MSETVSQAEDVAGRIGSYTLLDALRGRRSRRFGAGMHLQGGPLSYQSRRPPRLLTLDEEAALAFAACGVTGYALAELPYESGSEAESGSGNLIAQLVGRTVASGDAMHVCTLFLTNDDGAWLVRRPQDLSSTELAALIEAAQQGRLVEHFERSRVRIADRRIELPRNLPAALTVNKWWLNRPGTTYFLPVAELTALFINCLLTVFDHEYGYFLLDDRSYFRPAGIRRFGRSRGGHLHDDPSIGRVASLSFAESWLLEFAAIEQGAMIQNLGLMAQALGLGGFPSFAAHPFAWTEAFGFRMERPKASRIFGLGPVMKTGLTLLKKDIALPTAVGFERGGEVLIRPYCPPYYRDMEAAVLAFVDFKFRPGTGTLRNDGAVTAWRDGAAVQAGIPRPSDAAIAATIACCDYIYRRYGRFPSNSGPFRTVTGYQAHHLDPDFYARYYRPEIAAAVTGSAARGEGGPSGTPAAGANGQPHRPNGPAPMAG
jgi:hypothetical protein